MPNKLLEALDTAIGIARRADRLVSLSKDLLKWRIELASDSLHDNFLHLPWVATFHSLSTQFKPD
jgi:hypothetical protein